MVNRSSNDQVISYDRNRCGSLIQKLWYAPGAIAVGFLLLVLPACESKEETAAGPEAGTVIQPAAEATSPVAETASPVAGTASPAAETASPVAGTASPVAGTASPVAGTASPVAGTASPVAGATTGAVAETPNAQLIGESVTVSTKVIRVISPKAFVVQDKESLGGQEMLVVTNYNSPDVAIGKNIELTGIVRKLVVVDVEKEYGFDLEPGVEAEFKDKPIITAKAIEKVD